MNLILETDNPNHYLGNSSIINYQHDQVRSLGVRLSQDVTDEMALAKKVYQYVRDEIAHSFDIDATVVTCSASEVLEHGHGICYAKSHLLAAILRMLGIPTGFCYQKLILDDNEKPWLVLHGLNASYLKSLKRWIRLDARGNKEGVNAEFSIEQEKLAFPVRKELGEIDEPMIFVDPNQKVVDALRAAKTTEDLYNSLPSEL